MFVINKLDVWIAHVSLVILQMTANRFSLLSEKQVLLKFQLMILFCQKELN